MDNPTQDAEKNIANPTETNAINTSEPSTPQPTQAKNKFKLLYLILPLLLVSAIFIIFTYQTQNALKL